MEMEFIQKVNLVEQLSDAYPSVREPNEGEIVAWDEVQIKAHYTGGPALTASLSVQQGEQHSAQPGGENELTITGWSQLQTPAAVRTNQLAATVQGYREQAIRDGIPVRKHGLFPPEDSLLVQLASEAGTHAFEKHLAGESTPYELLKNGSWTSGDEAAQAGFDLRLFYKESAERDGGPASLGKQQSCGITVGAARLGERASIGNGYFMSAHGGAIESLLDEATAELGKMEFSPMLSTIEAEFKIRKSVPLHTTLRIECEIKEIKGMRCWVHGCILDSNRNVLATCVAQLVDLQRLWAAQGS